MTEGDLPRVDLLLQCYGGSHAAVQSPHSARQWLRALAPYPIEECEQAIEDWHHWHGPLPPTPAEIAARARALREKGT